jgi:hypothetical protein
MSDYLYFKFRAINKHMIESIVEPSLYFAKPTDLNDPFDCTLSLREYLEKAILVAEHRPRLNLESIKSNLGLESWHSKFNSIGVCAFSLSSSETLLWSHYADHHKGVCVLYKIPESFILDKKNKFIGISKVNYGSDSIMSVLTTKTTVSPFEFIPELIKNYLTTKSPSWAYECEARIIIGRSTVFFGFPVNSWNKFASACALNSLISTSSPNWHGHIALARNLAGWCAMRGILVLRWLN